MNIYTIMIMLLIKLTMNLSKATPNGARWPRDRGPQNLSWSHGRRWRWRGRAGVEVVLEPKEGVTEAVELEPREQVEVVLEPEEGVD